MNYLKQLYDRLQIAIGNYKTPKSVMDKLNRKTEERQYKPQVYTSNRKSIFANPPFDGKKL